MIDFLQNGGPLSLLVDRAGPLVSWVQTHTKWLIIAAIFAVPAVALFQGAFFLARYRLQYGDEAPCPLLPSHGVAIVSPVDRIYVSNDIATESSSFCSIFLGHDVPSRHEDSFKSNSKDIANGRFSDRGETSEAWGSTREKGSLSDFGRIRRAADAPAMRLLFIGDSLAAGVGVSKSATPVLPEVIAKSLSRALGGRAVFWTCIAEPGASSGWIVRELEKFQSDDGVLKGSLSSQRTLTSLLEDEDLSQSAGFELEHNGSKEGVFIDDEGDKAELDEWRNRLSLHSRKKKSDLFGEFDVACVMTGLNDLKGAIMPWLLQGDEIEFRRAARERGGDYTSELKRVVDAVADKMKSGLRESLDRVRSSVDNIRDRMAASTHASAQSQPSASEGSPLVERGSNEVQADIMYPLVVLPALPSNLPVLQIFPFIYFLLPLIWIADRIKRRLAEKYPHAILYVEPSSVADMLDFESGRGLYYEKMVTEDTLLSLKDKSREEIERVEAQMREYYEKKGKRQIRYVRREGGQQQAKAIIQPANVRLGAPGASLLSLDGIHPNDGGYDFWGRYIAAAILREWNIDP